MFAVDRRTKILTLGAMCFALFMAMLDNTVVNVALPSIQLHFGSGVSGLQWIIDGYTLVFAAFMLTGGTLGDLYGRKRIFLIGLTVFTAGSLIAGLAPSLNVLIAGRAVQGLGAAALLPGTLSILTQTFPDPKERAQAIGIWAGVSGMALAAGPIVGGALVDSLGWQSVFFLNIPIGIVAFFVAARVVRESQQPRGPAPRPGRPGAGDRRPRHADLRAHRGQQLRLDLAADPRPVRDGGDRRTGLFIWVELRSRSPMLDLSFFRNRTFAAAATVAGLVSFGMFGVFFFLTLFLQNVQGYSAFQMGLRSLPHDRRHHLHGADRRADLAGRIGPRIPMTVGLAIVGVGMLLMERITPGMPYSALWWNLLMLGIGMGLVMTPMTAAVMGAVPRARAGMASATSNASREVGGVFGIALLGAIVTHWFASDLRSSLEKLRRCPPAVKEPDRHAGRPRRRHGARHRCRTGSTPHALHHAVDNAFVSGMHVAFLVSAGSCSPAPSSRRCSCTRACRTW